MKQTFTFQSKMLKRRRRNRNARSNLREKSRAAFQWPSESDSSHRLADCANEANRPNQKDVTRFTFATDSSRPGEGDASALADKTPNRCTCFHVSRSRTSSSSKRRPLFFDSTHWKRQQNAMESESCQSAPATWWAAPVPRRKGPPVDPRCPVGWSTGEPIDTVTYRPKILHTRTDKMNFFSKSKSVDAYIMSRPHNHPFYLPLG
jgi:hypothetical protein